MPIAAKLCLSFVLGTFFFLIMAKEVFQDTKAEVLLSATSFLCLIGALFSLLFAIWFNT